MITLRNVLLINGISSGITGIGLTGFAPAVAAITGINDQLIWYVVGIFLIAFGLFVTTEGLRHQASLSRVRIITALDVSWVIGSLIVATSPIEITIIGLTGIIMVACWVAMMAFLQYRGMRALAS